MAAQPYLIASVAVSIDGYLDDGSPERLILSGPQDLDQIDQLRSEVDAILVGAGTVRRDDPSLLVRSVARRRTRVESGLAETPVRVVVGAGEGLPAGARVFDERAPTWVLDGGPERSWALILAELAARGVRRLLVEGGAQVHSGLLSGGYVDELRLAVAPMVVGDPEGTRWVAGGAYLQGGLGPRSKGGEPGRRRSYRRMRLLGVETLDDLVVSRYRLVRAEDERWLRRAIDLAGRCSASEAAFSVGAVLVGSDGTVLGEGWSRQTGPTVHAEQAALAAARTGGLAPGDPRWADSTMYTSLEPCSRRASHPVSCTQEILGAGIGRVVMAWREPDVFVDCEGAELLAAAGVDVIEVPWLAAAARASNTHLPAPHLP